MSNPLYDYFFRNVMARNLGKREKAQEVIRAHVVWSMGAGIVPVPALDVAAVTAVQLNMISQLSRLYQRDYAEQQVRSVLQALAGGTVARVGASAIKAIPIVGSVVGGASMAVLSAASTYALGQVFLMHFEKGGSISDLNAGSYRQAYKQFVKEGRELATFIQQNPQPPDARSATEDAFSRLEKLAKLKDRGVITEAEYLAKKEEILKSI